MRSFNSFSILFISLAASMGAQMAYADCPKDANHRKAVMDDGILNVKLPHSVLYVSQGGGYPGEYSVIEGCEKFIGNGQWVKYGKVTFFEDRLNQQLEFNYNDAGKLSGPYTVSQIQMAGTFRSLNTLQTGTFSNGKLNGTSQSFDPKTKKIRASTQYVNGLKQGQHLAYNGESIIEKGQFKADLKEGRWERPNHFDFYSKDKIYKSYDVSNHKLSCSLENYKIDAAAMSPAELVGLNITPAHDQYGDLIPQSGGEISVEMIDGKTTGHVAGSSYKIQAGVTYESVNCDTIYKKIRETNLATWIKTLTQAQTKVCSSIQTSLYNGAAEIVTVFWESLPITSVLTTANLNTSAYDALESLSQSARLNDGFSLTGPTGQYIHAQYAKSLTHKFTYLIGKPTWASSGQWSTGPSTGYFHSWTGGLVTSAIFSGGGQPALVGQGLEAGYHATLAQGLLSDMESGQAYCDFLKSEISAKNKQLASLQGVPAKPSGGLVGQIQNTLISPKVSTQKTKPETHVGSSSTQTKTVSVGQVN